MPGLNSTTRSGDILYGWKAPYQSGETHYNPEESVNCDDIASQAGSNSVTLKAMWKKDCDNYVCTIDLDLNGGEVGTGWLYYYQGSLYLDEKLSKKMTNEYPLMTPSRSGYTFQGYYLGDKEIINAYGYATTYENKLKDLAISQNLVAKWQLNSMKVNYYMPNAEKPYKTTTCDVSDRIDFPEVDGIVAWNYNGQTYEAGQIHNVYCNPSFLGEIEKEANIYGLEAIASGTKITLKYVEANGNTRSAQCSAGNFFTLPDVDDADNPGYIFKGWIIGGESYVPGARLACASHVLGASSGTVTAEADYFKPGNTVSLGGFEIRDFDVFGGNVIIVSCQDGSGLAANMTSCPYDPYGEKNSDCPNIAKLDAGCPVKCIEAGCSLEGWYTFYTDHQEILGIEYADKIYDANGVLLNNALRIPYETNFQIYPRCVCD